MDETTQNQLRFIANEKSIADLQKQVADLQILAHKAIDSDLQGKISAELAKRVADHNNFDSRLKALETPKPERTKWKFW